MGFDSNYVDKFLCLAQSIVDNAERSALHFHAVASDLRPGQHDQLFRFAQSRRFQLHLHQAPPELESLYRSGSWSSAVYNRLLLPELVAEWTDRLLYLDCDMLVLEDLSSLFARPLHGHILGAVYDNYVQVQPLIGITEPGNYFNSGMLLIDVAGWRQNDISQRCIDYLRQHPEHIKYVDQCALNAVFAGNWERLPSAYNTLTSYLPDAYGVAGAGRFLSQITILHFTLQRPWVMLNKHPYTWLYWFFGLRALGRRFRPIEDYDWSNLGQWLRIQLYNLYIWTPGVAALRRGLRAVFTKLRG